MNDTSEKESLPGPEFGSYLDIFNICLQTVGSMLDKIEIAYEFEAKEVLNDAVKDEFDSFIIKKKEKKFFGVPTAKIAKSTKRPEEISAK